MKKIFLVGLALILAGFSVGTALAIQIDIVGTTRPWDPVANPSFDISTSGSTPSVAVNSSSGLSITSGDMLAITYVSGLALAGAGGSIWNDANGADGEGGSAYWPADSGSVPGAYISGTQYLLELLGTFADSTGVIVGNPFAIGNGPTMTYIPTGAVQLLLGFNDGWYNDNGGSIKIEITETPNGNPVPEPTTMLLFGAGLIGLAARGRKKNN
jgi:hypothetical protein